MGTITRKDIKVNKPYEDLSRGQNIIKLSDERLISDVAFASIFADETWDAILIVIPDIGGYAKIFEKEPKSTIFHKNTCDKELKSIPDNITPEWLKENGYEAVPNPRAK